MKTNKITAQIWTIIFSISLRLSEPFIERFDHIDWRKIRGFRNIVAHNYFGIDAEEIWDIIQFHLPKLKDDLSDIIKKS
ncbi:MAG: DUF86 domain-containing protein [Desulfobulbaceae bacterium]|nr:DUF86 domain-containing protein [Desulfobulbaceae bacterium]